MKRSLKYFLSLNRSGPDNMAPVFVTKDLQIIGEVRFAKANTHIFKVIEHESKKYLKPCSLILRIQI
ncbi:MAG: hypothetical protein IPL53_22815 [Ignavibacteria bacterium]|nr:hypothetical protein [Ignavibacteria bacterium]